MAAMTDLIGRVRMEIGDPGKSFVWTTKATDTKRYEIPYSPVRADTLAVFVENTDVSDEATVEEHTGFLTLDDLPTPGDDITVDGTYFRFFTDEEIETIVSDAAGMHLHNRVDGFNRKLTVSNMDAVEELPLALLASWSALYTLATDSSFDIDISTPDGVHIPRSQRYRQLMEMAAARKAQYDTLCQALNIGITRIEVFTLRRISKSTNRYVPVFRPQEIDDRTQPERLFLPIPTYGAEPIPTTAQDLDLVFTQGDYFELEFDFPWADADAVVKAQARPYPASEAKIAPIDITVIDVNTGRYKLSITAENSKKFPLRSYWDMEVTLEANEPFTYFAGSVFVKRQITRD